MDTVSYQKNLNYYAAHHHISLTGTFTTFFTPSMSSICRNTTTCPRRVGGGASHVDEGLGGQDALGWVGWGPVHMGTNRHFFAMWSQIDTIPSPPADASMLCLCEGQLPLCTDRHAQRTLGGTPVSSLATQRVFPIHHLPAREGHTGRVRGPGHTWAGAVACGGCVGHVGAVAAQRALRRDGVR